MKEIKKHNNELEKKCGGDKFVPTFKCRVCGRVQTWDECRTSYDNSQVCIYCHCNSLDIIDSYVED